MELEEAIKNCKQFIDENKDRPIILHKSIDIVLKELDRLQNKCIEYDVKICPERYIKGQAYMEDKILKIIKEQKAIYEYDNNKPKIIAIEELLNKLKKYYIK